MERILANAIVDVTFHPEIWRVTVTGQSPHDQTRVYTISAKSDNDAAKDGINRFVAEMEGLVWLSSEAAGSRA